MIRHSLGKKDPMQPAAPLRFLALGDSYTVGEGIFLEESWPYLLAQRLTSSGFPCSPPEVIAKTGWSSDELLAGIEAANPQGPYDIVTIMIGVNNQYRGRHRDTIVDDLHKLVDLALALAEGKPERVYVISIPDWGYSPFGQTKNPRLIRRQINAYNKVIAVETRRRISAYIDVTKLSRLATRAPQLNAADHLHPSGAMHHLWMERIATSVLFDLRWVDPTTSEET
jgi:lysophospholipase L1-like esterase